MYQLGTTERVFNAQLRGAAVFSETHKFLRKAFAEDESIFLYDPSVDLATIRERLEDLASSKSLPEIAAAGQKLAIENHLADNRVDEILHSHPAH